MTWFVSILLGFFVGRPTWLCDVPGDVKHAPRTPALGLTWVQGEGVYFSFRAGRRAVLADSEGVKHCTVVS